MTAEIREMLDKLADFQAAADAIRLEKEQAISSVLTPEIQAQVNDIEAEFAGKAEEANNKAADLEKEIKDAVVSVGETVKGEYLQAVFNKGRTSFDTASVKAYLKAQGIYDEYVKEGSPYTSIRKV
jgi:aspartokinase